MSLLIKINNQCSSKVGKEEILPALRKILIILYITRVYNRGQKPLYVSRSFVIVYIEFPTIQARSAERIDSTSQIHDK